MNNGIINVLKPPGMTSHDVVSYIRRVYSLKRVGHAGTLDPAAAGVLPVALGQATRMLEYLTDDNKGYRVEMTLGFETDTGDDTGTIIQKCNCALPQPEEIAQMLKSFVGQIEQVPPMYSAIKIDGRKLYELAREGITVERKSRGVHIDSIKLIRIAAGRVLFDVECSKGTYIRSLCIDIGRKLGCLATMSFLVRTRVGQFDISESRTLEELACGSQAMIICPDTFINMPSISLCVEQSAAFKNGQVIQDDFKENGLSKVYDTTGTFIGIGKILSHSAGLKPVKVLSL
jgi:tRNA pseudouridine 55 synthase